LEKIQQLLHGTSEGYNYSAVKRLSRNNELINILAT